MIEVFVSYECKRLLFQLNNYILVNLIWFNKCTDYW